MELNIRHTVEFFLVYWPEEQQVSMVARSILDGGTAVGDVCSLKLGRSKHQGKVIEIGRFNILEVTSFFLEGRLPQYLPSKFITVLLVCCKC